MGIFKRSKNIQMGCMTCNRIYFLKDLFCYCPYCYTLHKGVNIESLYLEGCKKCGTQLNAWSCPDLLCGAEHYIFHDAGKIPQKMDENKFMFILLEKEHLPYMKGIPTIRYKDYKSGYRWNVLNYPNHHFMSLKGRPKTLYIPFDYEIPERQYNDQREVEEISNKLKTQYGIKNFMKENEIEEEEKPSMIGDILSVIFQKDILNYQIEVQELENKLSGLKTESMIPMIETINKIVGIKEKNAAAEITVHRADLLKKCTDNIDKLSSTSLRYILLSFANPNLATPIQDSEILEELEKIEIEDKNEDLKSKKYDNMLKKDKYDEIKKKRREI